MTTRGTDDQVAHEITQLRGVAESTDARLANIHETLQATQEDIRVGNAAILESVLKTDHKMGFILESVLKTDIKTTLILETVQATDIKTGLILETLVATREDIQVGNAAILEVLREIRETLGEMSQQLSQLY